MMSQQELISVFDDAKASFNGQGERSGYLKLYDSSLIAHGFPPNLAGNFYGVKVFYTALWAAFPDSHLEFDDIVVQGDKVLPVYVLFTILVTYAFLLALNPHS